MREKRSEEASVLRGQSAAALKWQESPLLRPTGEKAVGREGTLAPRS